MNTTEIEITDSCFKEYCAFVHQLTGIQIRQNRQSMLVGRLRKRMRELGVTGYEDYLSRARNDRAEQGLFVDLVTTNETYFYRTPRIWDFFSKQFLPEWFAKNPGREFRAWSGASSSGEEAHTLGILCHDFKKNNPAFRYSIVGTDISQEMVDMCKEGQYAGRSIQVFRTTRPELFNAYMKAHGAGYRAIDEIRAQLKFQQHNLFNNLASPGLFDYVLLRNVLIYFVNEDQEKVLAQVRSKMHENATLVIGESESLSQLKTRFDFSAPLIYRTAA